MINDDFIPLNTLDDYLFDYDVFDYDYDPYYLFSPYNAAYDDDFLTSVDVADYNDNTYHHESPYRHVSVGNVIVIAVGIVGLCVIATTMALIRNTRSPPSIDGGKDLMTVAEEEEEVVTIHV